MKLTFLVTRRNVETKNERHRMHTANMVLYLNKNILIGCDNDWMGKINGIDSCLLTLWGKEGVYYSQRFVHELGAPKSPTIFSLQTFFLQLSGKYSSYFRI
jgi:hypothetical protein